MKSMRSLFRRAIGLGAVGFLVLLGGFFVFCATLPRAGTLAMERIEAVPVSERGIIVLTGGGGGRIAEGLSLQAQGLGHRVLISGVHPRTTKADIAAMGAPEVVECCVDLGPWAKTTRGNAIEARDWLRANGYEAAIVVTSDFHMPRAIAELRDTAPGVMVIGVPVPSNVAPETGWMSRLAAWRLLASEYLKFVVVSVRSIF